MDDKHAGKLMGVHFGNAFADGAACLIMNGDHLSGAPADHRKDSYTGGKQACAPILHGRNGVGVDGDIPADGGGKGQPASFARPCGSRAERACQQACR